MVATHGLPSDHCRRPAYLLQGPVSYLLNQLYPLGPCTLVVREQGLSLAKTTSFGLFIASPDQEWNRLRDLSSGLETNQAAALCCHLLDDPLDHRPLLTLSSPGCAIDLTVRLEAHFWDSPVIRELIRRCEGVPVSAEESWASGAGAWLDDWEARPSPRETSPGLREEVLRRLRQCRRLEVEVTAGPHHTTALFSPAILDSEGSVIRIADQHLKNVVFADVADSAFRVETLGPSHLLIRREPAVHLGTMAAPRAAA